MPQITLDLPDFLTPEEARVLLAIRLFADKRVSCGRAAQIAGLREADFIQELGKRQIPVVNYAPEEVESDLRNA